MTAGRHKLRRQEPRQATGSTACKAMNRPAAAFPKKTVAPPPLRFASSDVLNIRMTLTVEGWLKLRRGGIEVRVIFEGDDVTDECAFADNNIGLVKLKRVGSSDRMIEEERHGHVEFQFLKRNRI